MQPSIKLLTGLLALAFINNLYAQKVLKPFPKNVWHVEHSGSAFSKSINYLPNGGAIVAADFNKGECGIARIDDKGKTLWEFTVKGEAVGVSRMNNNAIVFYSNKEFGKGAFSMKNTAISSTVRGAIINIENGKLIKDILMYDNGERAIIDSKPLNRPDGSFSSLFVRVTNNDGYVMGNKKITEKTLTSAKILAIGIDGNFSAKPVEIKSPGQDGLFTGVESGANDDLYFSFILDDQLVTERFNSSGKSVNKLSAPFSVRTNRDIKIFTTIDAKKPTSYFTVIDYTTEDKDNVHQAFEFNFAENKVSGTGEQAMDKAYLKSFEVSEIKEIRNAYKSDAEYFNLLNFLVSDERIVIIKGYQYSLSNDKSTRYQNGTVALEIYDRKWNKLKTLALDRRFELFEAECRSVGATINNGKLYTILPAFSGIARLETLFAQIDLTSLKVEKFAVLDNPYINRSARGPVVESDASIWLKDGVLIENCGDESGIFSSKSNVSSFWQKVEY
jgi:hypothetical protein